MQYFKNNKIYLCNTIYIKRFFFYKYHLSIRNIVDVLSLYFVFAVYGLNRELWVAILCQYLCFLSPTSRFYGIKKPCRVSVLV